jgi:recombination protein RecT
VTLKQFLSANDIQNRLKEMLGDRASSFSNSIINVVSSNSALQACDPATVIKAAMISASLDLPIDPALGFAAIVPYKESAQFQLMYKGVIQLCIRSGQYETIHDTEVYRDELESYNPITGEVVFRKLTEYKMRPQKKWGDVVGFFCSFRLLKGFRSSLYMTTEEIMAHAERFSRAYQYDVKFNKQSCPWSTDPIAMGRKTVILRLLKRYGIMSVEMQDAVVADAEDENTRQVESKTLEPTQGRQAFVPKKGEQPPESPEGDQPPTTEEPEKAKDDTATRLCPGCNTQKTGKFFRSNGRLVCRECLSRENGTQVEPTNQSTPPPQTQTEQSDATDPQGPQEGVTEPQEGQAATSVPETPKEPIGTVSCKFGHLVARTALVPSPLLNPGKGEIGLCPTCKANGRVAIVKEGN